MVFWGELKTPKFRSEIFWPLEKTISKLFKNVKSLEISKWIYFNFEVCMYHFPTYPPSPYLLWKVLWTWQVRLMDPIEQNYQEGNEIMTYFSRFFGKLFVLKSLVRLHKKTAYLWYTLLDVYYCLSLSKQKAKRLDCLELCKKSLLEQIIF